VLRNRTRSVASLCAELALEFSETGTSKALADFCETTTGDAELLRQGSSSAEPRPFTQLQVIRDTIAHDVGLLESGSDRRLDHDSGASRRK
jgi:hypothetical protein